MYLLFIKTICMFIYTGLFSLSAEKELFDGTVLPSSPGSEALDDSVFPVKDNPKIQKNTGQNFPYTGLTALNTEYRPWN